MYIHPKLTQHSKSIVLKKNFFFFKREEDQKSIYFPGGCKTRGQRIPDSHELSVLTSLCLKVSRDKIKQKSEILYKSMLSAVIIKLSPNGL